MMYIRYILMIILFAWLPEVFVLDFGFEAYSNSSSQPPMSDRRGRVRPSSPSRSRPPLTGRRKPLQRSLRSRYMQQEGFEVGVIIGTAHSLTDIGTGKASFMGTHWETTDLNVGAFGRYRIDNLFAVNASLHYARIHSADSLSPGTSRYDRGFYFQNQIFELSVKGEFYVPRILDNLPVDLIGFLGIGVFYHNPKLTVPDPDNYEQQSYSLIQPAIPIGLGLVYYINNNYRIGLEVGHRMTFTDHLDGFTRTAGTDNDAYFLGSIKISYFFGDGRRRFTPY